MFAGWKKKAGSLKMQLSALMYAYRDRRTPWYARAWVAVVVAYAFSPIDLIPDFIPLVGYLDDLVLLPLGVFLALKMIPAEVMRESRTRAEKDIAEGGRQLTRLAWIMAIVIALVWIVLVGWLVWVGYSLLNKPADSLFPIKEIFA
jgi:uncharacterized membrane protein YkvA (DUF1232 family)